MAEKVPIPVDPNTGVPLALIHAERPAGNHGPLRCDFDHTWFYSTDKGLTGDAGRALRYSLGQWIPRWEHELKNKYAGPPKLPEGEAGYFKAVVAGCARLVSPYALDFTKDDWTDPVLMSPKQYAYVTHRRRMHIQDERNRSRYPGTRDHLGRYIAAYAIEHGLSHISEQAIDEFLNTKNMARRARLGDLLLQRSVEVVLEPVAPDLRQVREMAPAPSPPVDLCEVVHRFFLREKFPDYYGTLAARLVQLQWA